MIRFQEKLKIGTIPYKVKVEQKTFAPIESKDVVHDEDALLGEHIPGLALLRIAVTDYGQCCPDEVIMEDYVHEILHAISRIHGLNLTEVQVEGLTNGLRCFVEDNDFDFRLKPNRI